LGVLLITAAEEVIWTKFEGFNHALFGLILLGAAWYQGVQSSEAGLNLIKKFRVGEK